jgi:hypothetical protein
MHSGVPEADENNLRIDSSLIGPYHVSEPIVDVLIANVSLYYSISDWFNFVTFSVVDEAKSRNELFGVARYCSNGLTKKEANGVLKSFSHGLRTFGPDWPVSTAIEELRKFQKTLH